MQGWQELADRVARLEMALASASAPGLMSAADKSKLDGYTSQFGTVGLASPRRVGLYYVSDNTGWQMELGAYVGGVFYRKLSIDDSGNLRVYDASGGVYRPAYASAFVVSSSRDRKREIEDVPESVGTVRGLRARRFVYGDEDGHRLGFVAEEVGEALPEAVSEGGVDLAAVLAVLVSAVQALSSEVEALKARV